MKVIIDRFEGDIAVVECEGKMLNIPRALVGDAGEGDAVMITPAGRNADLTPGRDRPHSVFERLRRRRRHRR